MDTASHPKEASKPIALIEPTWDEYVELIERLIAKTAAAFRPDRVVGIASGGLIPAMIMAKHFRAPLAIISAASYSVVSEAGQPDRKGGLKIGGHLATAHGEPTGKILLVDDLTDSGDTIIACAAWVRERLGPSLTELRTAVIWHKTGSAWTPDFCAEAVAPGSDGKYPWICQPFEKYERAK